MTKEQEQQKIFAEKFLRLMGKSKELTKAKKSPTIPTLKQQH